MNECIDNYKTNPKCHKMRKKLSYVYFYTAYASILLLHNIDMLHILTCEAWQCVPDPCFYALSHLTPTNNYRPVNQVLLLPQNFHIIFVTPSNIYARLFHAEDVECHTYLIPCRDLQQKISGDWFVATLLTNVSPTRTERETRLYG